MGKKDEKNESAKVLEALERYCNPRDNGIFHMKNRSINFLQSSKLEPLRVIFKKQTECREKINELVDDTLEIYR